MAGNRLAKLTRPRTSGLQARERLFALLDQARQRPVIWIVGPPGAGKTSLLSTWIETRELPCLWYQVDAGDGDPATFFYYLGRAAQIVSAPGTSALPLFSQEHPCDIVQFARRYFRELFERLPEQFVLVLDNYQEAPDSSQLQNAVTIAAEEIPEGCTIAALSRTPPPRAMSRLVVNDQIFQITWHHLQLTLVEAAGIAQSRHPIDPSALSMLVEQTRGWVAGLTLMLEQLKQTGRVNPLSDAHNLETVFDYFATQLFDSASVATQRMLMKLSYLPSMTPRSAAEIAGNPDAGDLLAGLAKRNLFTDRREGDEVAYQFHGLFHAFLRAKARTALASVEQVATARKAAGRLEEDGQQEEAFALYRDASDWSRASSLILRWAELLVTQGRKQTVRTWVTSLPDSIVEVTPWLCYWLGISLLGLDHTVARQALSKAYQLFGREKDQSGQIACAAASAESFYPGRQSWADLDSAVLRFPVAQRPDSASWLELDRWIDRLIALVTVDTSAISKPTLVRALTSLVRVLWFRRPQTCELPSHTDRLMEELDRTLPPDVLVTGGTAVLLSYRWQGKLALCDRVIELVGAKARGLGVSTPSQVWWLLWESRRYGLVLDLTRELALIAEAEALARNSGLVYLEIAAARFAAEAYNTSGAYDFALNGLRKSVEPRLDAAGPADRLYYHEEMGLALRGLGEREAATQHSSQAESLAKAYGYASADFYVQAQLIEADIHATRPEDAAKRLSALEAWIGSARNPWVEQQLRLFRAGLEIRAKGSAQLPDLSIIFEYFRSTGVYSNLAGTSLLCDICAEALRTEVEPYAVRELIRRNRVPAPAGMDERWPWSVKMYCLGQFRVALLDQDLFFERKAPKKALALLKALIAFGARQVPESRLMDALWPGEEADAARQALSVTLARLRRLLKSTDAIEVSDAKLSLSEKLCWVDARAFESALDAFRGAGLAPDKKANVSELAAVERAFGLYAGHFLDADDDYPWVRPARDRLRSKLLYLVSELAGCYEDSGEWGRAASVYRRALELDNLAEPLYRRLILCQKAMGERSGALETFRRCREMVSVVLGIHLSPETEALGRELMDLR